ncbi:MAG TPA: hypothetical protein VFQ39_00350 [Longimicrobium sp.]|nr:hypothetical protein [Longimicrobium sp.]
MRPAAIIVLAFAFACTRPRDEAPRPQPDVSPQSMRVPEASGPSQISGVVTKRQGGAVVLDSGGATPVPLRIASDTEVTVDGKPGTGDQIREGDLVRAAYRYDKSGEPVALQVVANTKPVQTEQVPAPKQPAQEQQASPQQQPEQQR